MCRSISIITIIIIIIIFSISYSKPFFQFKDKSKVLNLKEVFQFSIPISDLFMTELLTTGNAVSNCDSNAFEKVWNVCWKKFRIGFW